MNEPELESLILSHLTTWMGSPNDFFVWEQMVRREWSSRTGPRPEHALSPSHPRKKDHLVDWSRVREMETEIYGEPLS